MNYDFLHHYLRQQGFTVYPHEIWCGDEECEFTRNRLVDVAAKKNGLLYAFEYKSAADRLLRAVEQVANYSHSFDYVVVVAEVPRTDISVNPKKGIRIKEILRQGAGLWTVKFQKAKTRDQKTELAVLMTNISNKAPIMSHEVGTTSKGFLVTQSDMWFWLFYSVLDRRSDASTFIYARQLLERNNLFKPSEIVAMVNKEGKEKTITRITEILKQGDFQMLRDRHGYAHPRTIVETALFIAKFDFNFERLYYHFLGQDKPTVDPEKLRKMRDLLWNSLQEIYGVGPRIASQIIRGLVLKSKFMWRLIPLDDDKFLEECGFNVQMASKLGILKDKDQFYTELGIFADNFLIKNRGTLSHVLWYLRKAYCNIKDCLDECPIYQHCFTYELKWKIDEIVAPTRQKPNPRNHEYVENKLFHATSRIVTIKKPQAADQTKLTTFI